MVNSDTVLYLRWVSKTQCYLTRSWEPIFHQQVKNSQYQRSHFKWGTSCAFYNIKGSKRHLIVICSTVADLSVFIYSDIRQTVIFSEMWIMEFVNGQPRRCTENDATGKKSQQYKYKGMLNRRSHVRVTKQQTYHFPSLLNALICAVREQLRQMFEAI